ncbi:multiheme c-type cytochrome [Rubinisphaera italica]|uniref:Cytochrome c-552/4 domain-containing protein n=1 Tax=Rubinisphaera italica TaxID=2527969 RepID=A0A5C5XI30_9PLAN|nr:multiheme c-type cytochrome [Rubinisphaera italica]TWT61482.1 hypothetical protein Pan54_22180 [Rubinisphaera italica]
MTPVKFASRFLLLIIVVVLPIIWQYPKQSKEHVPLAAYESESFKVESHSCLECHAEIVKEFKSAPHARTLASASDFTHWDLFLGKSFQDPSTKLEYRFEQLNSEYFLRCDSANQVTRVDWIFGSGRHAQTPISLTQDFDGKPQLLELAVSWYPENGLGPTLGQTGRDRERVHPLGTFHSGTTSEECFACHSTWLALDEKHFISSHIIPNVGCVRCHYDAKDHAKRQTQGLPDSLEDLSILDAVEMNRRCGVCHRSPDEIPVQDLTPDNKLLIRFAPVGMSMSQCFIESKGIKCTLCHNPHRLEDRSDAEFAKVCHGCHNQTQFNHAICPKVKTDSTECLSCHMPQVEVQDSLRFTDHWIRVRD